MLSFCGQSISWANVDGKGVYNCDDNDIKEKEKHNIISQAFKINLPQTEYLIYC